MHIMRYLKSFILVVALIAVAIFALVQIPITAHAAGSIAQINAVGAGGSCQTCHAYKNEGQGIRMALSGASPINEGLVGIGGGSGGHQPTGSIVTNHHFAAVRGALAHGEQARLMKHIDHSVYVSHVKALLMHTKRRHLRRLV